MKHKRLQANQNYTANMLPQTRKEIFIDVVKLQWRTLMLLGAIVLIFSFPLLVLQWQQDGHILKVNEIAASELLDVELEQLYYDFSVSCVIRNFAGMLAWGFLGFGLSGVTRILRQFAWEENVRVFTDFVKGVKDNGLHMFLLSLLFGFIYAVGASMYQMLPYGPDYLSWILLAQIGISVALIIPICLLAIGMIPIYSNSLLKHLLLSFAVYLKAPIKTFFTAICCCLIFIPMLIPAVSAHLVGGTLACALSPFVLLAWKLYSYNLFDSYINTKWYPELIGKGIYAAEIKK